MALLNHTIIQNNPYQFSSFTGMDHSDFYSSSKDLSGNNIQFLSNRHFGSRIVCFSSRKSQKKARNDVKTSKTSSVSQGKDQLLKDTVNSDTEQFSGSDTERLNGNMRGTISVTSATRSVVLQSCISTSVFLLASGALVRQASHIASAQGWQVIDASNEVSFNFETWHIGLIIGLVVSITSCRYMLLSTWQEFAESSEAANQQVLGLLQPLDYAVVAFLPGISEELLFRGALLPLLGRTWESAVIVGTIFGFLHLSGGRKYSFAIWATFVGIAYGMATVVTSSIVVPIVSHSLNNLIGGIIWRYTSEQRRN